MGVMIGILLDIFNGLGRNRSRAYRFWLDVIFGPLAAVMLCLGSLAIMDGQLHPLLLFGAFVGVVLERLTIGRYLSNSVAYLRRVVGRLVKVLEKACIVFSKWLRKIVRVLLRWRSKPQKMAKKEGK